MDGHFLLLCLLGFFLCPLSSLALQRSGSEGLLTAHLNGGVLKQSPGGKRLLLQERKLQATKAQAGKEEVKKSAHKPDGNLPSSEGDAELPAGIDAGNTTKPGDEEPPLVNTTKVPPPPPSIEREETRTMGNKTDVTNPVPNVEEFDGHLKDNDTSLDKKPQKPAITCGGSHCEDPKKLVRACLSIPGDGAHKLSLFITYEGDTNVVVKVTAPEFLIADPPKVSVSKGKSETIQFLMDSKYKETLMEAEVMQNKSIVVTSMYGDCEIAVPTEYLRNSEEEREPQFSSFLPSVEPRVILYLLVFVFIISCAGAWLCYKCRGRKRAGEVKYQQLEMNGPGQSTPKERTEAGTDGWDEVWDDDWEDTEAAKSSSRLSQSLSSRGLAARRGAKDGWDTSWDD